MEEAAENRGDRAELNIWLWSSLSIVASSNWARGMEAPIWWVGVERPVLMHPLASSIELACKLRYPFVMAWSCRKSPNTSEGGYPVRRRAHKQLQPLGLVYE